MTGACDFEISQTSSKLPAFSPRKTKCTPALGSAFAVDRTYLNASSNNKPTALKFGHIAVL